jgi:antitoxin HicB
MTVRPITQEAGGGYLGEFPNLPGCMSDGDRVAEALANAVEAQAAWLAAMREAGRLIPGPGGDLAEGYSGKWVWHTPRSLHRSLAERAKQEGVSLNMLLPRLVVLTGCKSLRRCRDSGLGSGGFRPRLAGRRRADFG